MTDKRAQTILLLIVISCLIVAMALYTAMTTRAQSAPTDAIPATIRSALLRGGVALVFGCYNSDAPNLDEFDAELPQIAAAGAGHVRLTCSMDTLEDGTTGRVRNDRYVKVVEFINLAWSYGLVTTIDVHNTGMREPGRSDWTDNYMWGIGIPAMERRHTGVVTDLAARLFRDVPRDRFILQPANEPIDQPRWYPYQRELFPQLRAACPDCTIAVMADDWQGHASTVANLNVSTFTQPFVVDVHFYDPIGLTHCAYPGAQNTCSSKTYPGVNTAWWGDDYWDRAFIAQQLRALREWRDTRGVFVNLGEFGTADALAQADRARYLGDVASVAREYGFGFTVYEWYNNFGIEQHPQVVRALFQSGAATPTPSAAAPTILPTATIGSSTATPAPDPDADFDQLIQRIIEAGNAYRAARQALLQTQQRLDQATDALCALLPSLRICEE